jgi:hypothetical protein
MNAAPPGGLNTPSKLTVFATFWPRVDKADASRDEPLHLRPGRIDLRDVRLDEVEPLQRFFKIHIR